MSFKYIISALMIIASFPASAAIKAGHTANDLTVIASPARETATSMAGDVFYTQGFDLVVGNHGDREIDLRKVCFTVAGDSAKKFRLDTIDDRLANGTLKPGETVKGFIGFSAKDVSVYGARAVLASQNCP